MSAPDRERASRFSRPLTAVEAIDFALLAVPVSIGVAIVARRFVHGFVDSELLFSLLVAFCVASIFFTVQALATVKIALIPGHRPFTGRCLKCGYDLTGLPRCDGGGFCPECGAMFREDGFLLVRSNQMSIARGIVAILGIIMCLFWPALVDLGWRLAYMMKGDAAEYITLIQHRIRSRGGAISPQSLSIQLYLLTFVLAARAHFSPLARPGLTVFLAHFGWTIIFTLLALTHFQHNYWWTNITIKDTTAWYVLPGFAAIIACIAPRLRAPDPLTN